MPTTEIADRMANTKNVTTCNNWLQIITRRKFLLCKRSFIMGRYLMYLVLPYCPALLVTFCELSEKRDGEKLCVIDSQRQLTKKRPFLRRRKGACICCLLFLLLLCICCLFVNKSLFLLNRAKWVLLTISVNNAVILLTEWSRSRPRPFIDRRRRRIIARSRRIIRWKNAGRILPLLSRKVIRRRKTGGLSLSRDCLRE